jgi:hypothetical protein
MKCGGVQLCVDACVMSLLQSGSRVGRWLIEMFVWE